ncbi:hypothetical protein BDV06DRAFT_208084 [Aspergillus oleicola]
MHIFTSFVCLHGTCPCSYPLPVYKPESKCLPGSPATVPNNRRDNGASCPGFIPAWHNCSAPCIRASTLPLARQTISSHKNRIAISANLAICELPRPGGIWTNNL